MATRPATVNDVLEGHVLLDLECLDRIYLNGYVPNLQVGGQVVRFLTGHRGFPIPSPALLEKNGIRFRRAVEQFAQTNRIPWVRFGRGDRKLEVMRPHLDRLVRAGRCGVAAIGVAQEFQRVFTGTTHRAGDGGAPHFSYAKADRRVTAYYFYVVDGAFGPAFVKVCAYFPYPVKIWLNGHEYAKRKAAAAGIGFTALANGFAATDDPVGLQRVCDSLGPGAIRVFCERWWSRLPLPLTDSRSPRSRREHDGNFGARPSKRQGEPLEPGPTRTVLPSLGSVTRGTSAARWAGRLVNVDLARQVTPRRYNALTCCDPRAPEQWPSPVPVELLDRHRRAQGPGIQQFHT